MSKIIGTSTFNVGPKVPIHFKIDWLAFTVPDALDTKDDEKFFLLNFEVRTRFDFLLTNIANIAITNKRNMGKVDVS